ncbi:MAG: hypothetical protein WAW61_22320 [Methylococcaceae bacterium]
MAEIKKTGLALLREPFPLNQISKLPKPTKAQTDAVKADFKIGIRCQVCGAWHHKDVVHLPYVGHAALTDRLLDCDPEWNWEPLSLDANGQPVMKDGGMWIKLTVCGVTRIGFGDSDGKTGPNATKELIGDALRNAAMRFGAALDLWHKGELHAEEEPEAPKQEKPVDYKFLLNAATTIQELGAEWVKIPKELQPKFAAIKDEMKAKLSPQQAHNIAGKYTPTGITEKEKAEILSKPFMPTNSISKENNVSASFSCDERTSESFIHD